jgi:hypothetical protein
VDLPAPYRASANPTTATTRAPAKVRRRTRIPFEHRTGLQESGAFAERKSEGATT